MVCLECNKDGFELDRELHSHLKTHKVKMEDYYVKHFNRRDFFTGEPIKFKNKDYYFSNDFNSKVSMRQWLAIQPKEKAQEYLKELLLKRKIKKSWSFAPTQVELRSSAMPSIVLFQRYFGDFGKLCEEIGLKLNYSYESMEVKENIKYLTRKSEYAIRFDTREQKQLNLDYPMELTKLPYGDYAFETSDIFVERKSLIDFIGTLTKGLERFKREIERAATDNKQLIVLVEESLTNALGFDFLPHIRKYTKLTPEYVFHILRDLCQSYFNIQFIFVDGRNEASRVLKKILLSDNVCIKQDLQLLYDLKLL